MKIGDKVKVNEVTVDPSVDIDKFKGLIGEIKNLPSQPDGFVYVEFTKEESTCWRPTSLIVVDSAEKLLKWLRK